ncbi:MAG TPA: hypothetical protein PKE30_15435 [Niabella sp.]|nr:hypothetical protein [Niabella sp.]
MKIKLIYATLIAIFCFAMTSCKKSESHTEMVLDKNLYRSAHKYAALIENRKTKPGNFTIENIRRNGNTLTIAVKGGCSEDDFHIVWDGSILFSNPGQVNLVLYNETETDCGPEKQFDIKVNLNNIIEKYDPKDFIFNVANGSMKQDRSLNPNGSVTTK